MGGEPWLRRKDETVKAYAAFLEYLKQPRENRTFTEAYRTSSGNPEARTTPGYFRGWIERNHWAVRADHYDDHILDQELKALEKQRKESRIRQARLGRDIQLKGREILDRTDELDAASGTSMIVQGQKVENIALGVATDITETSIRGEVSVHGSIEQLLSDPRTRAAALTILESLGSGKGHPDGAGDDGKPEPMGTGPASDVDQ